MHGPTRPAELGLWTGGVWGAAPGDAGTEFSLSPGAARGNRGAKCLSCPRRLRAGAGASPGLHGLASGSSACWSSKATPGKGTLLPFWELLAGHLHRVKHSPKWPRVRSPGAQWDPTIHIHAPQRSCCPAAVSPRPRPAPAPELGGGTVWVGSWPWTGHVRRQRRWDPRMWKGWTPGEEDTRTPRACTAGLPRRGPPAGGW